MSILENIHGHQNLVQLTSEQRQILCSEIREFLISHVSKTGGHVSSNLGVVELTVAIETVFNTAKDRLVFDVGHQSYVHKILTDRQSGFSSLRQFGGMAGFPKPGESDADAFVAGHASSSVSVALGMARARTLSGQDYDVVALLGDGAATGGMAYEGLSDASVSNEPMVVILNDNAMSIDRNVGGMASHLRQLRTKEKYLGMKEHYREFLLRVPGGKWFYRFTRNVKDRLRRMLIPATIFESMGFTYLGPVDGHDVEHLITLLRIARDMRRPVVLHVMTQKGRGYQPAQEHPKLFHGIGKFDPLSGEPSAKAQETYSDVFGKTMVELAEMEPRLCAITAAMPGGTGLLPFKSQYSKRMFDVGIAEEHAVSMAGGLAKQGMIPVIAVYSTFLQRAYDSLLQDICMLGLHVVFAVDRAGLVGEDGETHHGIYDVGYLRHAPGLTILSPASTQELEQMLNWAVLEQKGPVAIRYPKGGNRDFCDNYWNKDRFLLESGLVCKHREGDDVTIITYGSLLQNALDAAKILQDNGINACVLRLLSLDPIPFDRVGQMLSANPLVFVLEEVSGNCGICDTLAQQLRMQRPDSRFFGIDLGKRYIPHGSISELYRYCGLDASSVAAYIQEVHHSEN